MAAQIDLTARIAEWREQLLDLSKRNRLINCRVGKAGALELAHPSTAVIWQTIVASGGQMEFPRKSELLGTGHADDLPLFDEGSEAQQEAQSRAAELRACLESPRLEPSHILTGFSDKALNGKLNRLALAAKTSLAEQGVNNLFLTFGLLRWFESKDSEVPILSPLLLVPARLTRSSADSEWEVSLLEEEVMSNYCLSESLRSNFGIEAPPTDDESAFDENGFLATYLQTFRSRIGPHARWEVQDRCLLGAFGFQKVAMWQDLGRNENRVRAHAVCRAVGGDDDALRHGGDGLGAPSDAGSLDEQAPPKDTHHILDCDSSQQLAIEAVKAGSHLVLDGPPGTGKSQTIANVIAESLAHGKTVLFVSEKAAALEVVKRRLDDAGLGDFCLELHSHKANKRDVITKLGESLRLTPERYPSQDEELAELHRLRSQLNAYARALHRRRFALNLSAYHVHGRLAHVATAPNTRCPIHDVTKVDASALAEVRQAIEALAKHEAVLFASETHPWRGCRAAFWSMDLEDDVRHHFSRLADLLEKRVQSCAALADLGFLCRQPTLADLDGAVADATRALELPEMPASWFRDDPRKVAAGYGALHGYAARFAAARQQLRAFRNEAIRDHDTKQLDRALAPDEWLGRVEPHPCSGLKSTRQHLASIADELKAVGERVRLLEGAADYALGFLHRVHDLQAGTITLDSFGRIAAAATTLSQLGRTDPAWFDAPTRKELRERASDFAHQFEQIAAERDVLSRKFTEAAFGPEATEVLAEVRGFNSFLRRMLPSWRRCRLRFMALYQVPLPKSPAAILADAAKLYAHRARVEAYRNAGRPYARVLRWSEGTDFDWSALLAELGRVDQLQALSPVPEPLAHLLSVEGGVDRSSAAAAAAALTSAQQAVRQALARLEHVYRVRGDGTASHPATMPLGRLRGFLHDAEGAVRQRCRELDAVARLVKEGMDVPLQQLREQFDLLGEARELHDKVRAIARALDPGIVVTDELSGTEWAREAELAGRVVHALRGRWPLPGHVLRVMIDPATRAAVQSAVEASIASKTEALAESLSAVQKLFDFEQNVSVGIIPADADVGQLVGWLRAQAAQVDSLHDWLQFCAAKVRLENFALNTILREMVEGAVPPKLAAAAFLKRFYRAWLDAASATEPALAGFRLDEHETLVERFRAVDQGIIDRSYERVRARLLADTTLRLDGWDAPASSERGLLLREVNKRRRHLPLRQLFKQIPSLLLKLKPCMMMSPLAVSTFLDTDLLTFDLVIFDEASQVRPHDAICAIYRGKQLLVAGDQQQLPPTNFFERTGGAIDTDEAEQEDEQEHSTRDFESILDVCVTLRIPRRRLRWHYRSRRESLIAFSNHHFYDGELVTFPSCLDVHGDSGVRLEYVPGGRWQGGTSGGVNAVEAQRTAALVVEHAKRHPHQSLGVITMNQAQQLQVYEELAKLRRMTPGGDEFFSEGNNEPFFVKNLENVQGDERDVMILTINYAKNAASGTLSHNFGPLNKVGGERRLNVAITRARSRQIVVSSIRADDIDLSRTASNGARLLRSYLDFAERGPDALASEIQDNGDRDFDSEFEREVAHALAQQGLDVRRQVGCGSYRIDLAVLV